MVQLFQGLMLNVRRFDISCGLKHVCNGFKIISVVRIDSFDLQGVGYGDRFEGVELPEWSRTRKGKFFGIVHCVSINRA